MGPADAPVVRTLQGLLTYADPDLVDAAIADAGVFVGRVAVDPGGTHRIGLDGHRGQADLVVGYAVAFPASGTADRATISELAVAPGHRRRGHGRALVEAVAEATDASALGVATPAENETALRFYRELGFERVARLEGFYRDGTDALRLVRRE